MTKKLKFTTIAIIAAIAIWGFSLLNSTLLAQQQPEITLKPQIVELQSLLDKGLENRNLDLYYSVLAQTSTGVVELMSLTGFPKHYHERRNHFFYILKGQANLQIGTTKTQIKPGDFIVIPAGKKYEHELKTIGDKPLEVLAFATPPDE